MVCQFSPTSTDLLPSMVCRAEHFASPWYEDWSKKLGRDQSGLPLKDRHLHRKIWEYCAIAQALDERGMLQRGRRGLGFAVGKEPLVSLFAAAGASVLATDIGEADVADIWKVSDQYSGKREDLFSERLIDRQSFDDRVSYQHADMRDLSAFVREEYDFIWSACSFEHLGSLEAGLTFVEESAKLLKEGGIAVHTTEYNVSSDDTTLTKGNQVLYRRQDLKALAGRLAGQGVRMEPMDFDSGNHRFDIEFDRPPWYQDGRKHVKLQLGGFVATSALIILSKP